MAKADYYEILGCKKGDSPDELKKAYRKLAMECHPDRNPGDKVAEQRFKDLSEAYDVLKDEQKRAAYDRFGHQAFENGGGGFGAGFGGGAGFGSFADIFEEMFGGGGGRAHQGQTAGRGSDLRYNLEVSLEDAFNGNAVEIRIPSWSPCEGCNGTGGNNGAQPVTCPTCAGNGRVRAQQGFFTIERTCHTCGGLGKIIKDPCRLCGGTGRSRKEKTLSVNIPAGVEDGTRIRVTGEGEAGMRGAAPGDLYVFISLKPHRFFQREGLDLHCRVPIAMTTAAVGGTIEVPNIEGKRSRVTVPQGTQSGQQMRLKAKGMPMMRGHQRGDLYIEMVVETPVNLTRRQRELLQEFEKAGGKDSVSPQTDGFLARMREMWGDLTE